MPSATSKIKKLREESGEGEIPYLSKSRIKKWETCPRQFYHTYIEGKRAEETDAMRQGTRIHETFEDYYANVQEHYAPEEGEEISDFPPTPEQLTELLPDDVLRWADWREFMANFIVWEIRRAEAADEKFELTENAIHHWLPVGIEAEEWKEDEDPPWMGFADVIVHAATVPQVDTDSGVVIVDFKTGKTPNKKYRDNGIFLEGEFYAAIFEDVYDVVGVAGFYPKAGDFLVSDLSDKRRKTVEEIVDEINTAVENGCNIEDFPIDEQPLCKWGEGEENQCEFYDECPSSWGVPAEKRDLFETMVDNGNTPYQIADYMGCEVGHVYYWKKKFNLD